MFCEPLRAWELAELFLGAKMLHDVMTGEGSCKGEKCHPQSWSELQVMPWAGRVSRVWGPLRELHRAQHLLTALCASCLPELINFEQSQSVFSQDNINEVSRLLGWGAGSPRAPWTGGCWWVLL